MLDNSTETTPLTTTYEDNWDDYYYEGAYYNNLEEYDGNGWVMMIRHNVFTGSLSRDLPANLLREC